MLGRVAGKVWESSLASVILKQLENMFHFHTTENTEVAGYCWYENFKLVI